VVAAPDDRHVHFCYDEIDASLDNVAEQFRFLGEEVDEESVRVVHGPHPVGAPSAGGKR
jgi:hypothetical protein